MLIQAATNSCAAGARYQLETAVVRGDVKEQQIKVYHQLADFWKDSAHLLLPYAYYTAKQLNWKILKKVSPLLPNSF